MLLDLEPPLRALLDQLETLIVSGSLESIDVPQERLAEEAITEEAGDDEAQDQLGEKGQHENETEAISSGVCHFKSSDYNHDTRTMRTHNLRRGGSCP